MYKLELEHTFSAAHQLTNAYDEKCNKSIHGHNWKTKVIIETQELKDGMVVDFTKIKEIIDEFDHKNLNEIIEIEPTAENLASIIYGKIAELFTVGITVEAKIKVTIWEGEKASITYFE